MSEFRIRRPQQVGRIHLWLAIIVVLAAIGLAAPVQATFNGTDNQADAVLGQLDFSKNAENFVDATGLDVATQAGVAVDPSGRLWVADTTNNRVLGWSSAASFNNGDPATIVLGQPDFNSNAANNTNGQPGLNPTASTLAGPTGLATDGAGDLFVSDSQNNRVLIFQPPFTNGMAASFVYGQSGSFTTNGNCIHVTSPGPAALCQPMGIAIDHSGDVFIADYHNHRVLEYDASTTPGTFNDGPGMVFGQPDYNHNYCNEAQGAGLTPGQNTLCLPAGVAVDSADNVYIADRGNNRVLEFNNPLATHTSNPNATLVFGQPNGAGGAQVFTTGYCDTVPPNSNQTPLVNANTLCGPHAVAVDSGDNLWVSDASNSRVLEFATPAASSNTTAGLVLGQTTFAGRSPNGNSSTGQIGQNTLATPEGLTVSAAGSVFVVDNVATTNVTIYGVKQTGILANSQNDRVLRFDPGTGFANGANATAVLGQLNFTNYEEDLVDGFGLDWEGDATFFNAISPAILAGLNPPQSPPAPATIQADAAIPPGPPASPPDLPVTGLNAFATVALDVNGHLFMSDPENNRVLGWPSAASFTNGQQAALVIGQPNFNSSACNVGSATKTPTASTLCEPAGIGVDPSGNLFVADLGNSRVLEYNPPFAANPLVQQPAAIRVFGQANSFTTHTCDVGGLSSRTPSRFTLCQPIAVALDSQADLYVADFADSRILEYSSPYTNGLPADNVFGQPVGNFSSFGCNTGTNSQDAGGVGTDSLCEPVGLSLDRNNNLYVADSGNSRVLQYLAPLGATPGCSPNPNGSGCAGDTMADVVLGQSGFTGNICQLDPSQHGLCFPTSVAIDPVGNAYAADAANSRVVEFDIPLANNEIEDLLFGQTVYGATAGLCNGISVQNANPSLVAPYATADSLCNPLTVLFDTAGDLYVTDSGNNRMLEYLPPFAATQPGGSVAGANVATTGSPGAQNVAAGSFTVTNGTGKPEYISAVTLTISNPAIFSAVTLTASALSSSPTTFGATTTFGFATPIQIPSAATVTFNLTGTIAANAAIGASSAANVTKINATAPALPLSFTGLPGALGTLSVIGGQGGAVALTSSGTTSGAPGVTVNAGGFSISNNTQNTITVSSVQVSLTTPAVFSTATLTSGASTSGPMLAAATTTFTLTPAVQIAASGSASFSLSAAIANGATGGAASIQSVTAVSAGAATFTGLPLTLGTVTVTGGGGSVTLASSGTVSGNPGASVAAGSFTVSNSGPNTLSVSSIQVDFSNSAVFSSATLAGGGATSVATATSSATTFTFSSPAQIPGNGSATFALSATIANNASNGATSTQSVIAVTAVSATFTGLPLTLGTVTVATPPGAVVSLQTAGVATADAGTLANLGVFTIQNNAPGAIGISEIDLDVFGSPILFGPIMIVGHGAHPAASTTIFKFPRPIIIPAGGNLAFTIKGRLKPTALVNSVSTVTIANVVAAGSTSVSGAPIALDTLTVIAPPGRLVAPPGVGFGAHKPGLSLTKTITLRAAPLNKSPVQITGVLLDSSANPGAFALSNDGCTGQSLFKQTGNPTCQIQVTYTATATGWELGSLTIQDNGVKAPQTIKLIGVGLR